MSKEKKQMNNYLQVVYDNYVPSTFDGRLVKYLSSKYFKKPGVILDVGCGTGKYMTEFTMQGYTVAGVDYDTCDFEKHISVANNSCDYIFCKSVIEHIKNTDNFLKEIHRILKPNGVAIFLTPAWEYNYRWFYDDHTHVKPFCRKGLQNALKINGFSNVEVKFFHYLPFVWATNWLKFIPSIIRGFTGDEDRWKDKEEQKANNLIRFSQEIQLLGIATK